MNLLNSFYYFSSHMSYIKRKLSYLTILQISILFKAKTSLNTNILNKKGPGDLQNQAIANDPLSLIFRMNVDLSILN